ncbi:MAG: hypothetical protein NDJ92_10670, partial [Thermoanaerobaculia bacterium]|nr:hypothetical protein [Thermoanaerobaculia bacterium]
QFLVTVDEREVKRFEVEIGGPHWKGMKDGKLKTFEFEPEMRGAIGNLKEYFESPEWKARMESFRDCDQFEKKIDHLEKRLSELEKQLSKK